MKKLFLNEINQVLVEAEPVKELTLNQHNKYDPDIQYSVIQPKQVARECPTMDAINLFEIGSQNGSPRQLHRGSETDRKIFELRLPSVFWRIFLLNEGRIDPDNFKQKLEGVFHDKNYNKEGWTQILTDFEKELAKENDQLVIGNLQKSIEIIKFYRSLVPSLVSICVKYISTSGFFSKTNLSRLPLELQEKVGMKP
ncbi:MAG: hypothetical protein EPO11_09545 [Gammaproteobacteria bacterium]|nr:MAG: hypothetical protein EPO11_09545 [Gammaproteobacteria bacterium]